MKKNIFRFIISAIAVLLVFVLVEQAFAFAVVPGSSYVRTQMNDFYTADKIDLAFVGPSFVYRGVNPNIIDKKTQLRTFNLGTSSQKPVDSYYMIKEAYRVHKIKYAVLDVSLDFYITSAYSSQNTSTYLVYDRMESSDVKNEYFTNAFDFNEYPKAICKSSHYSIYSFSQLAQNVKYKFSDDYKNYIAPDYGNEWYGGKGFVDSVTEYSGSDEISELDVSFEQENIDYLKKIINFCKENDIKLIAVTSPKSSDYLKQYTDYNSNMDVFDELFESNGIDYVDLNRSEEISNYNNSHFMDIGHLNGAGAELYSEYLSELINSKCLF
ncbi:MAG: hypothetical protein IJZ94_03440 [Clostridia bacterium]|nr:hypothetical protein [Clostridia bacterium]